MPVVGREGEKICSIGRVCVIAVGEYVEVASGADAVVRTPRPSRSWLADKLTSEVQPVVAGYYVKPSNKVCWGSVEVGETEGSVARTRARHRDAKGSYERRDVLLCEARV